MRHRVAGSKLGRNTPHRKAMWRNMAISLFTHGQITTTIPKAKSIKPFVEKLITAAKQGDLAARRRVIKQLGDPIIVRHDADDDVQRNAYGEVVGGPRLVKKLFEEIAPKYADRNGGYTRIIKLAKHRIGDGADLCVLQLVSDDDSGPQVGGRMPRRAKADKRNNFAAELRKARSGHKAQPEAEVAAEAAEAPGEPEAAGDAASEEKSE